MIVATYVGLENRVHIEHQRKKMDSVVTKVLDGRQLDEFVFGAKLELMTFVEHI
jgi:hypothetical protein